jgi:hypothetical protein
MVHSQFLRVSSHGEYSSIQSHSDLVNRLLMEISPLVSRGWQLRNQRTIHIQETPSQIESSMLQFHNRDKVQFRDEVNELCGDMRSPSYQLEMVRVLQRLKK